MSRSMFAAVAAVLCAVSVPVPAVLAQDKEKLPDGVSLRLGSSHLRHVRGVYPAALSPDARLIASNGGVDNRFCLWDAADGKLLLSLPATDGVNMAADVFSHDGKLLAGRGGSVVYLWDVAKRQNRFVLPTARDKDLHPPVFSRNDKLLAVPSVRGPVRLYDVPTGDLLHILPCDVWTRGVVFLPDGKTLVTAEKWAVLRFWDVASGKKIREIELNDDHYFTDGLAVSPDGKMLALNQSGTIAQSSKPEKPKLFRMVEVETGKELWRVPQTDVWSHRIRFAPDGKHVLRGVQDGNDLSKSRIELVEPATGKVVGNVPVPGWAAQDLQFSADGRTLMGYGNDYVVHLWSFPDMKPLLPHIGHTADVSSLAFSADGKLLCSSGQDNTVIFWDLATGQPRHTWPVAAGWWREALVCADGKHFVCALNHTNAVRMTASNGKAIVYRIGTGEQVHKIEPVRGMVALSPDGKTLAAGDANKDIRLWNVSTGEELSRCKGQGDDASSIVFSPDGQWLAASSDGRLRIWWTATGQLFRTFAYGFSVPGNGASRPLQRADLAFSPDGLFLAVTSDAYGTEVWDVLTKTKVRAADRNVRVFRHNSIAASPLLVKRRMLGNAVESEFFDVFGNRPLGAVPDWINRANLLTLSPNGESLAVPELDGTILIARAADLMKRPLPTALPAQRLAGLWTNLQLQNEVGYQACLGLAAGDRDVVAFLGAKLQPVKGPDPRLLAKWLDEIDDDEAKVREQARRELEAWGSAVELPLRSAHAGSRYRTEGRFETRQLLVRIEDKLIEPDALQSLRAVGVLAAIGTPEAREVLRRVAAGFSGSRITESARLALAR